MGMLDHRVTVMVRTGMKLMTKRLLLEVAEKPHLLNHQLYLYRRLRDQYLYRKPQAYRLDQLKTRNMRKRESEKRLRGLGMRDSRHG